ncbi:uncharacterized protein LOC103710189 isoform X5 [Phoenix dactylifera]|uniref:Uncharacterized protein LOC103710189 isoform X5 n=1 Tax=Phoenix dactylifera TaxID=42345 RepID=A0A8B8J695_PHODC|nr:uncharacterized protein LOC103710189 isoform X5 [Phoenix dactylifera]
MEYLEPGREVLGFQNPSPSGHGLQPRSAEALVLPAKRRSPDYLLPFRHDPLRHPLPARLASGRVFWFQVVRRGVSCSTTGPMSSNWACALSPGLRSGRRVHKIVDLSGYPDREAMWHFEVIEAYKLFYVPSVE